MIYKQPEKQKDNLCGQKDNLCGQKDNLCRQKDNLCGQKDNLCGQKDNLCGPHNETHIRALCDTLPRTIEGRLEGKRGTPRRTWVDDLRDRTSSKRYNQIKIAAERRNGETYTIHLQHTAVDATLNE